MKRAALAFCLLSFVLCIFACSQAKDSPVAPAGANRVVLLISEQNIEGPQRAWWASEVDLSTSEAAIAKKLIAQNYTIIEPSALNKTIKQDPAFRMVGISDEKSVKLAKLTNADYVILGKAVASAGGNIPQSSMRSCFANITAKLIRVRDGKVIAYLDASGSSAHMDVISGGREALAAAGEDLSVKIADALSKAQ